MNIAQAMLPVVFVVVLAKLGAGTTDVLGMILVLFGMALWILAAFEASRGVK